MDSDLEEYGNEGDDINVGTLKKPTTGFGAGSQVYSTYGGAQSRGLGAPSYAMNKGFGGPGMGSMGMGGMGSGMGGMGSGMGSGFGGMQMSMGMGLGMGGMNMGGMNTGNDAYEFDLDLDHIKAVEPPKSDPKEYKGKEKGGIMKDPSKKKEKKEVKIGNTETIHYEKESSHYSSGQDKKRGSDSDDDDESDDA